jgi:hypothetical protein
MLCSGANNRLASHLDSLFERADLHQRPGQDNLRFEHQWSKLQRLGCRSHLARALGCFGEVPGGQL